MSKQSKPGLRMDSVIAFEWNIQQFVEPSKSFAVVHVDGKGWCIVDSIEKTSSKQGGTEYRVICPDQLAKKTLSEAVDVYLMFSTIRAADEAGIPGKGRL